MYSDNFLLNQYKIKKNYNIFGKTLSFLPKMLYYCIQIIASYNDNQF